MSAESDSFGSDWSVDVIERVHGDSSNDECVSNVENIVESRNMRTRTPTPKIKWNNRADVEGSEPSRSKRRAKATRDLEFSKEGMISEPAAHLKPSSLRRSSRSIVLAGKTNIRTTSTRQTCSVSVLAKKRLSHCPVRHGLEEDDEPRTQTKRRYSESVIGTPRKNAKMSKPSRKSRVKAEPKVTPKNTADESKDNDQSNSSCALRSRKKNETKFETPRRRSSARERKTPSSWTLEESIVSQSTPKSVRCDPLKLKLKKYGNSWSSRKLVTFAPENLGVSSSLRQPLQSSSLQSEAEASESTPTRRSARTRKSFEPFQSPMVEKKRTPLTTGSGCPRKLYVTEEIYDTDYSHETSLDDDSDDNYEPISKRSKLSISTSGSRSGVETPRTPRTSRLSVKQLTPSLPTRSSLVSTPTTPKDRAMKALHISSVPESLPCRQREFDTIYNFLLQKIRGVDGGFLYVYGIPGAGKTATVERVIKRLVEESKRKKVNKFEFIDINGMHLKKPKDAYCQIWRKLKNDFVSAKRAKILLEHKFNTVFSKQPIVLLIDEFDMLFNRTLSVVDTILDWIEQSKLIVVAIANSKDLIEEIDKSSSKSRMLRERLYDVQFKTYTYQQLQEIIEERLKNDHVFTSDAIQLLARKSALSGDVRLALNLCRRVLAEAGNILENETISIERVQELLERIHKDPKIEFMRALSRQDQMLLRAIRDVILISGYSSCSLEKNVYKQYKALCIVYGVNVMDEFFLFRSLRLLESYAIITLSDTDCTIHTEISLGNNLDYIQIAFPPSMT